MISLQGLSKSFKGEHGNKVVFNRVDLDLPSDRRIALLGPRASGKTTLLRLLAGLERPTEGKIERRVSVSLPVGYVRGFVPTLTPRQNVVFFARCYGAEVDEIVGFVREVAEIDSHFDRPVYELPGEMRQRFAFAVSYAIPFDLYLVDGVPAAGSPEFRQRCMAMFEERAKTAGVLFATPNPKFARSYCNQALLIANGKITLYDNIEEALKLLKQVTIAA